MLVIAFRSFAVVASKGTDAAGRSFFPARSLPRHLEGWQSLAECGGLENR
jgi:hypothetical protein